MESRRDRDARSGPLRRAVDRSAMEGRERRVYLAPNAPFGWIDSPPGVNRLLGVRWLAGQLYPQALSGDLRAVTRDFYARYYQVDLNDAQLDQLLDTATRKLP